MASGKGTLGGTVRAPAVNGIAVFPDVTYKGTDSFTVAAASTGLTPAVLPNAIRPVSPSKLPPPLSPGSGGLYSGFASSEPETPSRIPLPPTPHEVPLPGSEPPSPSRVRLPPTPSDVPLPASPCDVPLPESAATGASRAPKPPSSKNSSRGGRPLPPGIRNQVGSRDGSAARTREGSQGGSRGGSRADGISPKSGRRTGSGRGSPGGRSQKFQSTRPGLGTHNAAASAVAVRVLPLDRSVEPGKPFSVDVELRNADGKVVPEATVPVTLRAVTPGGSAAELQGTMKANPFDGMAHFEALVLPEGMQPEGVLLTATAPGLAPSPAVPLSGGEGNGSCPLQLVPKKLVISNAPAGAVPAGGAMLFEVKVHVPLAVLTASLACCPTLALPLHPGASLASPFLAHEVAGRTGSSHLSAVPALRYHQQRL